MLDPTVINRKEAARIFWFLFFIALGCTGFGEVPYQSPDRKEWQLPERVIQSLGIRSGDRVADLGSGTGYFTFRLADAVGKDGKIYATDIDQDMNSYVVEEIQKRGYKNIKIIQAHPQDPLLPKKGVDIVFTCNAYHHLENRIHYFTNIKKYLRQGGSSGHYRLQRRRVSPLHP